MIAPRKYHARIQTLTRQQIIKFLQRKGAKGIGAKPLENCYTQELLKLIARWRGRN